MLRITKNRKPPESQFQKDLEDYSRRLADYEKHRNLELKIQTLKMKVLRG